MASFKRSYTQQELRVIAGEVLETADPFRSASVTHAQYDAARTKAGFPDSPQAKYVAKRLGHRWPQLVRLVRDDSQSAQRELDAHADRRAPSEYITQATARHALSTVSARLGQETVSAADYEAERAKLLDDARDHHERYQLGEALPTSAQLNHRFGSWKKTCQAAGIEPPAPAKARRNSMKKEYTVADCERARHAAIDWAVQEGRGNLTLVVYREFARTHPNTPHQATVNALLKRQGGGTWSELRSRVQLERARQAGLRKSPA